LDHDGVGIVGAPVNNGDILVNKYTPVIPAEAVRGREYLK
jgi:DNA-directed RNA polymerase beta subunit